MGEMKTILAALDLEAGSDVVLDRAVQLAGQQQAQLILLHVLNVGGLAEAAFHAGANEGELRKRLEKGARDAIEALVANRYLNIEVDVSVAFGVPHDVITRVACERAVDIMVIGPAQAMSLKEKILGSTADRVLRTASTPVLVVRRPSAKPYKHVAAAIDFSPQAEEAVRQVCRMVPEATLHLIHVFNIPLPFQQAMLRAGSSQAAIDQYRSAQAKKIRNSLEALASNFVVDGLLSISVIDGEPATALIGLSKQSDIDLLALGSHGRGTVMQALLGSVAQRVLREAVCDVLVTRTAS